MQTHYKNNLVRGVLFKLANKTTDEAPPKAKPRELGGIKLPLTDAQIVEARRRHENEGATMTDLAREFECDLAFMRKVLDYQVRQKLFPPRAR